MSYLVLCVYPRSLPAALLCLSLISPQNPSLSRRSFAPFPTLLRQREKPFQPSASLYLHPHADFDGGTRIEPSVCNGGVPSSRFYRLLLRSSWSASDVTVSQTDTHCARACAIDKRETTASGSRAKCREGEIVVAIGLGFFLSLFSSPYEVLTVSRALYVLLTFCGGRGKFNGDTQKKAHVTLRIYKFYICAISLEKSGVEVNLSRHLDYTVLFIILNGIKK